MTSASYAKGVGNSCIITVEVTPGADRTEVAGVNTWRKALRIRIAAPAKNGEANAELIGFLADRLHVPTNSVDIVRGTKSSIKVIRLPVTTKNACAILGGD